MKASNKVAAIYLAVACIMYAMGRILFCSCGEFQVWISGAASPHTSQHLFDPYSFSHLQHGLIFFALLTLIKRPRLYLALLIEGIWEIAENTPIIINRYRSGTSSLDYFGDSIVNAMGDLTACAVGFYIAMKLRWTYIVGLYVAIELTMIYLIRDSLLINVIMLIWPIPAIRTWQLG